MSKVYPLGAILLLFVIGILLAIMTAPDAMVEATGSSSNFVSASAGGFHTCGVTPDGAVKCWGSNTFGQLGNGETSDWDAAYPGAVDGTTTQGPLMNRRVVAVSAGDEHSCAVMEFGYVYCWGANEWGQLGIGSDSAYEPARTLVTGVYGVTQVSAGGTHTCALTYNYQVWCWGLNENGQLGSTTTEQCGSGVPRLCSTVPVQVPLGGGAVQVSVGGSEGGLTFASHTCALMTSGGVKCWGSNSNGQLGDGTLTNRIAPVNVSGLTTGVAEIGTGRWHSCARLVSGGVKCWGWNFGGVILGDAGACSGNCTIPSAVVGLTQATTSLAVGAIHACATLSNGSAMCWGSSDSGQLGIGTYSNAATAQPVCEAYNTGTGTCTTFLTGVDKMVAGSSAYHTCSTMTYTSFRCWGRNSRGQLGNGTTTYSAAASTTVSVGPAILLLHGFKSNCDSTEDMNALLVQELNLPPDRVHCIQYSWAKGVRANQGTLNAKLLEWYQTLGLKSPEGIHVVAHSMGGLLARYYVEQFPSDVNVSTLQMVGTPNEGNTVLGGAGSLLTRGCNLFGAFLPSALQAACELIQALRLSSDTQGVRDLASGSPLLATLNDNFDLPTSPLYRLHYGLNDDHGSLAHPGSHGDCIVSDISAFGPQRIFQVSSDVQELLSHTHSSFPGLHCGDDSLMESQDVAEAVSAVIAASGGGGGNTGEVAAAAPPDAPELPLLADIESWVSEGGQNVHQVQVPSGVSQATFAIYYPADSAAPQLSMQLNRPDDSPVQTGDGDLVDESSLTEDAFGLFADGKVIDPPTAGTWDVTVSAANSPSGGVPYVLVVIPDSQVALSLRTDQAKITTSGQVVVTMALFDDTTKIPASAISASVVKPDGNVATLSLVDNGTGGDKVSGDFVYSATFSSTTGCGIYPIKATATGTSATEGTVTRITGASFEVHVTDSQLGNPCDSDDDNDGRTDAAELDGTGSIFSDPFTADTDADGCTDGQEASSNELTGGRRDPINEWDYFNPSHDGLNRIDDVLLVVQQYFIDEDDPAYTAATDRTLVGPNAWNLGPPNGQQRVDDIVNIVKQYFHDC